LLSFYLMLQNDEVILSSDILIELKTKLLCFGVLVSMTSKNFNG